MHLVQFIDQHRAEIAFVIRATASVWRAVRRARRVRAESQPERDPQGGRAGSRSVK